MNNLTELKEIFTELKPTLIESPCRCGYSDSEFPYGCEGYDMIKKDGKLVRCDGFFIDLKKLALEKYISELPINFRDKVIKPDPLKHQSSVVEKIRSNTKAGIFIYGESKFGKTHLLYRWIYKAIEDSKIPPKYIIVKSLDLLEAWSSKYNTELDEDGKYKKIRERLMNSDIVMLDDFNKISSVTEARAQEIFALLDYLRDNKKILLISSQESIESFCRRVSSELSEISAGRKGAIQNRLHDLCLEIHAVKNTQMEL